MKNKDTRLLAIELLNRTLHEKKNLKELFARVSLPERERAFLQELTYGVLRKLLYLDWRLLPFLKKPEKLPVFTLNNLRLGVYQIIFMRVPAWAAVNEAVRIEKSQGRLPALVNAVLRRVAKEPSAELPVDSVERLAIEHSHPRWLVRRWISRFGPDLTEGLLAFNNTPAELTLRVNTLRINREELLKKLSLKGLHYEITPYSPYGIKISGEVSVELIKDLMGYAYVQDEAAQLVTLLLEPMEGQRILDCCAAPGGKTSFIAQLVKDNAEIVAVEKSKKRIGLLRENLRRQGITSVEVIQADVRELSLSESFQRIMVDAPCSSLGVIRRNPDVRYRYIAEDLRYFFNEQISILLAASRFLQKNGVMVYTVCSFEPEETFDVVKEFLNKRKDYIIIDYVSILGKRFGVKDTIAPEYPYFLSFPSKYRMDGFFGVRFKRI